MPQVDGRIDASPHLRKSDSRWWVSFFRPKTQGNDTAEALCGQRGRALYHCSSFRMRAALSV